MKKIAVYFGLFGCAVGAVYLLDCTPSFMKNQNQPLYTVVSGDTLNEIGAKYGVSAEDIRQWNNISGDLIEVGQVLVVGVTIDVSKEQNIMPNSKRYTSKNRRFKSRKGDSPTADRVGDLVKPTPKPCMDLYDEDSHSSGEEATGATIRASAGLSSQQIQDSMTRMFPKIERCVTDVWPTGQLVVDFLVKCDGTVAEARESSSHGLSEPFIDCSLKVLTYGDFPAHDLPDGMTFSYPIDLKG